MGVEPEPAGGQGGSLRLRHRRHGTGAAAEDLFKLVPRKLVSESIMLPSLPTRPIRSAAIVGLLLLASAPIVWAQTPPTSPPADVPQTPLPPPAAPNGSAQPNSGAVPGDKNPPIIKPPPGIDPAMARPPAAPGDNMPVIKPPAPTPNAPVVPKQP
jgi:hypothetical protein